ncbi:MAG: F0F1 ATP synthase subunit A [Thermonemataceae bacterium]
MNWISLTKKLTFVLLLLSTHHFTFAKEEQDIKELIFHHISDSHEWHLATIDEAHITIPLPIILYTENGLDVFMSNAFHHATTVEVEHEGEEVEALKLTRDKATYYMTHDKIFLEEHEALLLDFSITKNVASMLISVLLLAITFTYIGSQYRKTGVNTAPKGVQSFFEPIITFVRDDIAKEIIGPKYEKYVPYLLTVFFFIWFNNMLGLMPGAANVTGNIAVTFTLAIFTWIITTVTANKNYWGHIFAPPGVPAWLLPIMVPVELIGIFTKPFSLMIRLFANITAGHIIILSLIALIFIFDSVFVAAASVPFAIIMNCLELFVAILQAYVFTLLTAMYFGSAIEEHH